MYFIIIFIIIIIIVVVVIIISQIDGELARNYLGLDMRLIIRKEIRSHKFISPQGVFLHVSRVIMLTAE